MENHFNCIYCYTNKVNGKKYIGQAKDFIKRHNSHIRQAYNEKRKRDYNVPFHNAIRRHGIENFEIEILKENLSTKDDLNYWECYYIVELDTLAKNGKGYNLASGGEGGNTYAGKTNEELAEISRKLSEANKGEKNPMYGKNPLAGKSKEELIEISRKKSEASKGKNNGMYGKNHSEEARAKQSEASKGKPKSEEHKKKISEAKKGKNNARARKIVSVDPFTKLPVFIWQYKQQATEFYSISISTLDSYLKGKRKTGHEYNGFLWYYADEWQQLTN